MIAEGNPPLDDATLQGFVLSPQQQRLWRLQADVPAAVFRQQILLRLDGALDAEALQKAIRDVVARHEILRTAFHRLPGMELPLQVILEPGAGLPPVAIHLVELGAEGEEGIARLLSGEARPGLDPGRGVVLLASLALQGPESALLLLELPALCADATACDNLTAELAAAYARRIGEEMDSGAKGEEDGEAPTQYADLADWQHQLLEAPESAEHLDRWREYLREREAAALLDARLPLEEEAPGAFAPSSLAVPLPAGLAGKISVLEPETQAPAFFLAAWQVLLARSAGRSDVLVGVLHDGRRYEELRGALGPLARFLPVHAHIDGSFTARRAAALAREANEEAARRQERFSWPHLAGELQGALGTGAGYFSACFEAETGTAAGELEAGGVRFTLERRLGVLERFKLCLSCIRRGGVWEIALRYDAAHFRTGSAAILAERYGALLVAMADCPDAPLSELASLGERERALLDGLCRSAPAERWRVGTIHRLFAEQAARTPEQPAVVYAGSQLTYAELNRRANRLARHLLSLGIEPETRVAVCFERSLEMVVAILGILKAGGAWVPLDPTHPQERMAYILDSSGAAAVLTFARLHESLPATHQRVLLLDEEEKQLAGVDDSDPGVELPDGALAYILYTSGSTGRPKGVQIEHRAAVNLLAGLEAAVLGTAGEGPFRASLNAPLAFDASVQQLILLLAGHTLHIVPEEVRTDGTALVSFLRDNALDLFDCTPSQLRILLGGGLLEAEGQVPRLVLVAGEAIDVPAWAAMARSRRTVFFNIYGPTECTVDATVHRIGSPPDGSIGRPLAGYTVRILDVALRPALFGAPGELAIGGVGLARGYAGRPDLTAARFVPDAEGEAGARLYRTGDLARHLPGGELEFLGRIDNQVKIRGYRIEPGEIEAVLLEHPAVREAAVVARAEPEGAQLVAYVLPAAIVEGGSTLDEAEMHAFLRRRLPVYMVPAAFVVVPSFPLTGSGKVDRGSLALRPLPESRGARRSAPGAAPSTPAERVLAEVWREILRLEEVAVTDNFFQLGGDSILSIQVIARARQRGIHLTARQMFEHQTIAELARVAECAPRGNAAAEGPVAGPVPLTPVQRAWFEERQPDPEHYNQTLLLEAAPEEPRLAVGALRGALARLLEHHDALRLRFAPPADGSADWEQRNEAPEGEPSLAEIDLSGLPAERRSATLEDAAGALQRSLNLAIGPLLRAAVFHVGAGSTDRFLMSVHHLAVDGVSWRILLEDLESLYRALSRGEEPSLPPKTTSFQHWAERLAEHARSPEVEAQAEHWLGLLPRMAPALPVDLEEGEDTVASVRTVRTTLTAEETRALLQDVPRAYRTQINDALLAALVEAFAGWTGTRRLWIEMEGHGREEVFPDLDVSRTVGWFTTVFPVLLDIEGADAPGAALKAVKEQLRAVPERGFAFGLLRHLGEPAARQRLEAVPRPEVLFNYLGQFDQAVAEGRLFRGARESSGAARSPRHRRGSLLEINGGVAGGRLTLVWAFSANRYHDATVAALAARFGDALRALVAHNADPGAGGFTPSDFPLAGLDQAALDELAVVTSGRLEDVYPATPMQEGLLFHSRLEPRSGAHLGRLSLLFRGEVNPAAFKRAWAGVLARYSVLRTGFFGVERERVLQVVYAASPVPLEVLDWRDLPEAERRPRLAAFEEESLRQGFDAARPPLLRLALIRLVDDAWRFVMLHHHAILDGWSLPILLREFLAGYEAALRGAEPELPRPASYRDYIAWLTRQDLGAAEAFWRRELAGFRMPTPLGEEGGTAVADPIFGTVVGAIPTAGTDALRVLARRHQLTVNTLVQGAWALLLRAHGGGDDVIFGVVTSGRSAPVEAIDTMVGLFVNTLPARVAMAQGEALVPWLQALQTRQFEQRQHEHSPLIQVQAWSDMPRGLPLFESLLAFENFPVDDTMRERASQTMGISEADGFEQSSYPLALAASVGATLSTRITWDPRRFDRAWAERMLEHLGNLLNGMAARPDTALGELPVLSAAELGQVRLRGADETQGRAETLPAQIAEWARREPDTVAVLFGEQELTYAELNTRANRLARHLRRCGVEPGARVGLAVERSPDLIAGLLGIWKAGAAYVPLDPGYPKDRLRWMAEDAGVAWIVIQAALRDRFAGLAPCLDIQAAEIALESEAEPLASVTPELPAYVIYTSGSTGRPKGVVVPHAGLPNLAEAQSRLFDVRSGSRVLQFASSSFDASVSEIAMAFWAGAALVLAPRESLLPGAELMAVLRGQEVTTATLPPSALAAMPEADLPALATLVVAGEACAPDLAQRWGADRRLINAYGPTETTVCATAGVWEGGGRLPLGAPIAGVDVCLLDPWGSPAPLGVPGELCVGGRGLAQGYLGLPERTAERFVPHPLCEQPGERLYRTGDLARLRPDGELEFLGRIDYQIKVRGIRVEPGEIEAVLRSHPAVHDAAVVARPDAEGGTSLVAYVVGETSAPELRELLRRRLPELLVPAHYAFLPALPLSPSGKVDRKALAAAGVSRTLAEAAFPLTPIEELLAGIFCQVLGLETAGAEDSFFDLGGHSLLAARVIARVQTTFGVELPLRTLFESPTPRALGALIEEALRGGDGRTLPPLVPAPRDRALPLSFAQERLWVLDQLLPGLPTYNMPLALALRGDLSRRALAAALATVVARHEVLRTTFSALDGQPAQVIRPDLPATPPLIDLKGLPEDRRRQVTRELAAADASRPFDLKAGPLLRVTLLWLEEALHVALVNVHHIVYDGWSAGVLVRELGEVYTAFCERRSPVLPSLTVQYADVAVWQREWLSGAELERQIGYWREHLAGAPALLSLPLDRPRPAVQTFRGAWVASTLSEETTRALQALARSHGATLFMVLLAGFQALLSRFSGQDDVVVGTPVANRSRPEVENLIGFFVNTLALRGRPAGDLPFTGWLASTRESALSAYTHQDLPFEKLVDELQPERSLTHSPLFQAMLVLQNLPDGGRLELPGVAFEPVATEQGSSKFDITLVVAERPQGLSGSWEHNPDLFDAATVERMARAFEALLGSAVAAPGSRLSDLPLLSDGERRQLLEEWNETGAGPEPGDLVHELAERWAERTPDAVAVAAGEESLTWAELDQRANQVARRLRRLRVVADTRVGLCVERSPGMIVGLLGILKAGGAYVPLDPSYPRDRLAWMIEDARMPVLLTQERLVDLLPATSATVLRLDADWSEIARESAAPIAGEALAESLAYVIYTSGSTGRPKGVTVPHRGWSNLADAQRRLFGLGGGDQVLQFASLSFDASAWEIAMAFGPGGTLVLGPPERLLSGEELLALLRRCTVATLPPTALAVLPDSDLPELGTLIVAGEACPVELARRWSQGRRFFNAYGPTETTVCATAQLYDGGERLTIGGPIARCDVYVLDISGSLAPIGVPGELHIGGPSLARGYLHLPERTAERFVPHPFSSQPGERLYRTGDLARRLPGGEIEFLGRLDHQIKVRGFRIEPGEIESALLGHPAVREAVVLAREDEPGDRRLVAYVVAAGTGIDSAELREWLRERLPRHAVPSALIELAALPLTPNGKVDRRALPAPGRLARRDEPRGPRTDLERLLARVWSEVLRVSAVGIHDNFFELGGDSILSIQVVARAAREGCRITPRQVFEHQTVAALATVAGMGAAAAAEQGPVTGPVPLTPIQRWFLDAEPVDPHHFNQSVLLAVRGAVTAETARRALAALAVHHDALRLRFLAGVGGWAAWNAAPEELAPAWERVDLSALEPAQASTELSARAALAQEGLDLVGPLVRGYWFDLPGGGARLLLVVHHLTVDGVSWRVLLEDLETACRQLGRGETVSLPPKTTSFQTWSRRLSEYALAAPLEAERPWWSAASRPGTAALPLNDSEGEDNEASVAWAGVLFSLEETRTLLQDFPTVFRVQIQEALLAALALTLARPGGSLSVAMEGHGREEIAADLDLSRTVGWFTTVFPVRLEVNADPAQTLQEVKEHLRALPGRGLGYGLLRHLRGELAGGPWPEVSFNYLGQFDQVLAGEDALFARASEPTGPPRSPRARRLHRLEVAGAVVGGRLRVDWGYGANILRRESVERLVDCFADRMRELISACRQAMACRTASYSPSDFPLAGLDRPALATLLGGEWGIEDVYPLSPLQEGILFHTLYQPGSGVYVAQLLSRFRGDLDERLLAAACRVVIDHHPVLRTSFHWRDLARPLQVVHGQVEIDIESLDWRHVEPEEQGRRLESLVREDRERGFDLSQAPVMRWTLVRTGEREHRLLWSHHHILLDGWSFSVVGSEFLAAYEALRSGRKPELPRHRPYRDYVGWLESHDRGAVETYWRDVLEGWSEPTPLPSGQEVGTGSETRHLRLGAVLTAGLQEQARRHQLTLNTLAQAAWGLLLGRHSGFEDVVFGATAAGRPAELPGVETMVGLFINTLPVRLGVHGGQPLLPWLHSLQSRQAELRQYEHTPLIDVQRWSEVPRGRPLFESILVFESYPREEALGNGGGDGGVEVGDVRAVEQTNYPLTVVAAPGERLALRIDFDRSRFDAATVDRLLGHLATLLEGMEVALRSGGHSRLADLPMLAAEERGLVLLNWGRASKPRPPACLHELFEARVRIDPDRVAVVCEEESLTYGELNRRANRVAHHLRRRGAGPESLVGLDVERSLGTVIGILGILKAGAAYLPFDPAYPAERLRFMQEDSGASLLLSRESLAAEAIGRESDRDLEPWAVAENLAYVIYTSGSTGHPKGSLITHGNVSRLFSSTEGHFGFGPEDVWTLFHSFAFDFSVWEIWGALLYGGRLVVVPWEVSRSPEAFDALLRREGVTVLNQTPSAFRQLLPWLEREGDGTLRTVIYGGEALEPATLGNWLRSPQRRAVPVNMYGITETTVHVTWRELQAGDADRAGSGGPIGRPIDDLRMVLLDRAGNPVPVGAPGEIHVGGAGLMRGYLNRPELTAERLVPSPFGGEPGARLYRSGDLARLRPDGDLEFLGRIDQQVKIRGFRIEPGEIEAALTACQRVDDTVVEMRDGGLVAYVAGSGLSVTSLREALKSRLPEYMVPSRFVLVDALPLTVHGKVDRRALAALVPAEEAGRVEVAPRSSAEELLAGIFAEVLGREAVGVHDSFFDLGGHSLLATQVTSRARGVFGVELPIRELFEYPAVRDLARRIEALLRGDRTPAAALVPVPRGGRDSAIPLSFAQERLWFLDQLLPGQATYNVPLALALRGNLSVPALGAALTGLAARHEVLRTTFNAVAGEPAQEIHPPMPVEPSQVDLDALPAERREAEARTLATVEAARPFDLAFGPLLRTVLVRLEEGYHLVLLTLHHIAADGWSLGVLTREVAELYAAATTGRVPQLPGLPVQYADFAVWQREWLSGEVLEEQIGWWRERLAGAPALLDLPLDRPRPAVQSFRGARVPARLPLGLSQALAAWSRERGATLFMTLLAGFQALLGRVSNQDDVVVGTPVANRNRAETEGLIGFFVNTLALRGRPEADLAFVGHVARVRETALGAYARQDLPFERLVEELQPERSRAHSPVFQVLLVLQNTPGGEAMSLPGLTLAPFASADLPVAKFDLTFSLEEAPSGLAGSLEYGSDLFDEATARRLTSAFSTLLSAAVENPDAPLADLPLLTPEERRQALEQGRSERPAGRPVCLHDLLRDQATRTPDAVAAVYQGEPLSYRQLDETSDRLGHHLRSLGVGPEVRVGLCLERSFRLLIGIFGVLKAGGAWVPLDPGTPPERMALILEDGLAGQPEPLLLAEEGTDGLVSLPGLHTLRLDLLLEALERNPAGAFDSGASPDHLAYVLFTSGSTGRPKGVTVTHRGLADLVAAQSRIFEIGPGSRVLQFASPGFDASVAEIAVTLGTGGTLHLASREAMMPGPDLAHLLREEEISVATLPPSALAVLPREPYPALRTLVAAGEACPPETARAWSEGRRFVNAYGPTEATVCASAEIWDGTRSLTAGLPIDGAEMLVLDPRMIPVPAGVTGEIHLAGPGLARGYLGRPDLTAEAFVPHPWSAEPGTRLYRTGDAGRRLPDGRVEVSGRLDRQVKLRGFRVEPGEVEAALERRPGVRQAAVVVQGEGEARALVAFVVGEPAGLRDALAALLPSWMLPSAIVPIEEMPLLPSGKPDRKTLARRPVDGVPADGYVEPRNPIEQALAEIFAQVLRVERVGVRDDFFARGGHSLLAVGLVARIEERLGRRLPLAELFEGATVERLAVQLSQPITTSRRSLVAMRPEGSRPPFFCVHPIGGGVTGYYGGLMQHLGPDQPFYGLQALELETRDGVPEAAIEAIAARYLEEVRTFRPHGPYLLGGASYGGLIAFEMARQLVEAGQKVALLALIDSLAPRPDGADGADEELPGIDDAEQSFGMARALARMYGRELDLTLDELRGLPLEPMLARVLESVRAAGLVGPEIDVAWLLAYRESFNARILGALRYRALPFPGRIVLLRSSDLGDRPPEALERIARAYDWAPLARGGVDLRWVPGDHETMLLEPNVPELAATLGEEIARAATSRGEA